MIVVVQGSNRAGNSTAPFARYIQEVIADAGEASTLIDLVDLPGDILHAEMYDGADDEDFLVAAERAMKAAGKWVFVYPEYNGSFPGVLKLFIDALSVRDYKGTFTGKFAALVGTATGRSGNLRGLDHFTAVLQHMGTTVMPQALPISGIAALLDDGGDLADEATRATLRGYVERLMAYGEE